MQMAHAFRWAKRNETLELSSLKCVHSIYAQEEVFHKLTLLEIITRKVDLTLGWKNRAIEKGKSSFHA